MKPVSQMASIYTRAERISCYPISSAGIIDVSKQSVSVVATGAMQAAQRQTESTRTFDFQRYLQVSPLNADVLGKVTLTLVTTTEFKDKDIFQIRICCNKMSRRAILSMEPHLFSGFRTRRALAEGAAAVHRFQTFFSWVLHSSVFRKYELGI